MDEDEKKQIETLKTYLKNQKLIYKELEKQMVSHENITTVNTLFEKLIENFEHFGDATMDFLTVCTDADDNTELKQKYKNCHKKYGGVTKTLVQWMYSARSPNPEDKESTNMTLCYRCRKDTTGTKPCKQVHFYTEKKDVKQVVSLSKKLTA